MMVKNEIVEALEHVEDPEIGMNVVDLGLIYGVDVEAEKREIHIDLTLTSPGCPFGPELIREIKREIRALDEDVTVNVDLVWQPLWHPTMMSDYAKDELGYDDELGLTYTYY